MKAFRKITAVLTVIIGIGVIVFDARLMKETANHAVDDNSFRYMANEGEVNTFDAKYASFGADFYTYLYRASDIMVDELNEINQRMASVNSAMETVVKAQNSMNAAVTANVLASDDLIETVNKVGGMVVAIGQFIFVYGLQSVGVVFEADGTVKPKTEAVVISKEDSNPNEEKDEE